jgi:mono/diheme cytochrome c family protein
MPYTRAGWICGRLLREPGSGPRRVIAAFALVLTAPMHDAFAADPPTFEADVFPLVAKYCLECHNAIDLKGKLDLERFETMAMVEDAIALWQRAAMRIDKSEMPPKEKPRPTPEERAIIAAWSQSLKMDASDCQSLASEESVNWWPGYVMSRRLNRNEYENTIRDLLGVDVKLARIFPADGAGGEGFDNNGSALFLSAIQIEKYLDAADLAMDAVLPGPKRDRAEPLEDYPRRATKEARRELVIAKPGFRLKPREAAQKVLSDFAARAWRRPAGAEEIERLLELFDRAHERGDGYDASLRLAIKAALVSPNFLFLAEPEPPRAGVYELGDYPLAARLSYFLWSSMPDEELRGLAAEGTLHDENVIAGQVLRMLRDPKSKALGELFAGQWLGISQLGETLKPDAKRYPEFDEHLLDAMRAETALVFNRVVREDRSLLELIDADYTYTNEELAAIYGIEGVTGGDMRLVQLADHSRGGVLGMAAVLTATSHPLRTSPVLRGKWVLEQLLGDAVPPPPPNVPKLPDDERQFTGASLREQLEAHRSNPDCAGCHSRMDPIGFGLENFDPIGRWRVETAGQPVDAGGVLPSGEKFRGPAELKLIVLGRKDEFARNLSRKMLGYALGRSLTPYDECVVDRCVAALKENEYRPSALFTQIVLSYPFRHRFSGGKAETPSARASE